MQKITGAALIETGGPVRNYIIPFVCSCLLLAGCASSLPKFQKSANGEPGYTLSKSINPQGFIVNVDLKGKGNPKYSIFYGYRAVGEECLARSFNFYDVAVIDPDTFEGYCYKGPDHPALAVEFTERGLDARPQHFVVGDLMGKTNSKLEKGDEILMIDGVPPLSVATIKAIVFRASTHGMKTVGLKIKRGEQEQELKEPIALFKNSSMGSTQLDLFRSRVP